MSSLQHPLVVAADRLAEAAHRRVNQLQPYTGLPYIAHPREVAALVAQFIATPEVIAGALVHDCIADTDETEASITGALGNEVAHYATELTEQYEHGWTRSRKATSEAARLSSISRNGKSIKCADVTVNVRSIVERSPGFARVYVPEKRLILPSLLGAHPELYRLAAEAVESAERKLAQLPKKPRP
ncbi:HD domain-containing protein [Paucibacter soli]|uniref:HD domain-containing protein n=1 Tax=Paucibacter soli TaxID=3133433 RepID=UPI003098D85A